MIYDTIQLAEGSTLTNITVDSGTSFPGSASTGEIFYRTDAGNEGLYVYDGSAWALTQGSSFSGGTVADPTTFSDDVTFSKNYVETRVSLSAASSTAIDCSLGNVFSISMGTNISTLTFSNVPTSGKVCSLTLFLNQDATGSRTVTWPASVKWASATAPTLTTTASKTDIITLVTHDGGTIWYGFASGLNF